MVQQSTNNIFENVYKFNGKELDESTGYYYYGARYYDPGASVFLSVDPLAEQFPGWTPYHYVHNNPINLIDPTGMSAEESDGWIVKDNTTEAKYDPKYDGTNTPEGYYYGTAFELEGTVYNADGTTESAGGGTSDCVSCHHTTIVGGYFNFRNPNVQGYQIWGAGSENYGISKRGGNYKSIEASSMWNIGVGGLATQQGSVLGIIQYFSSASGLYGNDNTNSTNQLIQHSYKSYDTAIIPYTNLPFGVVPVEKDTFLSKSNVNNIDWK